MFDFEQFMFEWNSHMEISGQQLIILDSNKLGSNQELEEDIRESLSDCPRENWEGETKWNSNKHL